MPKELRLVNAFSCTSCDFVDRFCSFGKQELQNTGLTAVKIQVSVGTNVGSLFLSPLCGEGASRGIETTKHTKKDAPLFRVIRGHLLKAKERLKAQSSKAGVWA